MKAHSRKRKNISILRKILVNAIDALSIPPWSYANNADVLAVKAVSLYEENKPSKTSLDALFVSM
jgi:hypothetical protein